MWSTTRCSSSTISDATSASTPTCATPSVPNPYYEDAAEFSDLYDSESFDPSYESLPLDEFEPLVRQVFDSSERSPFELANSYL